MLLNKKNKQKIYSNVEVNNWGEGRNPLESKFMLNMEAPVDQTWLWQWNPQTDWLKDSSTTANLTIGRAAKKPKAGITTQCLAFSYSCLKLSPLYFIQYFCLAQTHQKFTDFFRSLNVLIFKKYNISCKRAHFFSEV